MTQLDRIEAKLDRVLAVPPSPTVTLNEAMAMFGVKSRATFYLRQIELNFQPYARGKYRRTDILNAIGREALNRQRQAKRDADSELRSEAQRKATRLNPDND